MEKKKRNKVLWIILILLLLLIIGLLVWFFVFREKAVETSDEDFFDPTAITGILPDMTEAEIQAELDRVVEEGMLNISIASDIVFQDGKSKGLANINNVQANNYIFKVTITENDTGETLYESGGIKPGQYIQYIELNRELEKGDHAATATFTAYTQDTHQIVGSAAAVVNLYVKE